MNLARRTPLVVVVLALTFLFSGRALAHANLVSSTPAAGATLASAPDKVTLVFSEELSPTGNSVAVLNASGSRVDNDDTTLVSSDPDRKTLTVTLKSSVANGAYTVNWKNMSADGHSEEGNFTFSIGSATRPTTPAPTTLPTTGGEPELAGWWLLLAALLLGGGMILRRRV